MEPISSLYLPALHWKHAVDEAVSLSTLPGGHATLHRMLQKACLRLRAMDHFTGHLSVGIKFGFELRWGAETRCFPTQDSVVLGKLLNQIWAAHPGDAPEPTKVSITLSRLEHIAVHTPSLFVAVSYTHLTLPTILRV